jgi:sirohydrochlorin cobaltochelatase
MQNLTQALADWIADGGREAGEIHIEPAAGGFTIYHHEDARRGDLSEFAGADAARDLARSDEAGGFRPLKTAPNLRRGWKLRVSNVAELRVALDYFYPAMLGMWHAHRTGRLPPVPLRATLARQTGMYAVTKKITDPQAQTLIGGFCRTDGGCLKQILWPLAPGVPVTTLPPAKLQAAAPAGRLPLLCHEACNLLVAKAREVVKKSEAPG